jgi:hypothetical protein
VQPQHGIDRPLLAAGSGSSAGQPIGDPADLGAPFELGQVLVATPGVHLNDRDQAAPGHEPDDQQPPLELSHQAGRIGVRRAAGPAYTRPR